jgi:predicted DsbA family dithiol-disulfide isomerase
LKESFDIEVQWRAFPLHPETPEDGRTLEELFAGRTMDIPAMLERLKKVAEDLGLPWGTRKMTFNSRLAQEMGKWAEEKGKGDGFHDAVFRTYFVDGKNIAKKDVLLELAKKAGLPVKEAREVLESGSFKEAVDEDWKLSMKWGVTAVPTFVIDGHAVVGAQPYDVLEAFLVQNGIKKRTVKA